MRWSVSFRFWCFAYLKMYFAEDEEFARQLEKECQAYEKFEREKAREREKENMNPIDARLETIDPTPCIRELFMKFNKDFFWNALGMVQVSWSTRMTTCAGLCSFEGGNGLCKIALSAPLLSLRPRKDLVETLLHEMIHAYLFVTNNYLDRNDHGHEFQKHMFRINREAGTNITIYHTFFNEVEYYQKHIWRCNGPCQNRKPYFGFVRRAMNRAPGPNDSWWKDHKMACNGNFIKISEPEKKTENSNNPKVGKQGGKYKDIRHYFDQKGSSLRNEESGEKSNIVTLDGPKEKPVTGVKMNTSTGTVVITNTNKQNMKGENPTKGATNTSFTKGVEKINTSRTKESVKMGTCTGVAVKPNDSVNQDVRETVRNVWTNKFRSAKPLDNANTKKVKLDTPAVGGELSGKLVQITADEGLKKLEAKEVNNSSSMPEILEVEKTKEYEKCAICDSIVKSDTKVCFNCIFLDEWEDVSDADEITCDSVCCPCCNKWIQESEVNSHLDECLTIIAIKEKMHMPL